MRNSLEFELGLTTDPIKQALLKKYLAYIDSLPQEDLVKLGEFEEELYKQAPIIVEEFSSKVREILYGQLDGKSFIEFLKSQIPRFKQEDLDKEKLYKSGAFGRLAMAEFTEKNLDTKPFIAEIFRLRKLIEIYLGEL